MKVSTIEGDWVTLSGYRHIYINRINLTKPWAKKLKKGDLVLVKGVVEKSDVVDVAGVVGEITIRIHIGDIEIEQVPNDKRTTKDKDAKTDPPVNDVRTVWVTRNGLRRFEWIEGKVWHETSSAGQLKKSIFEEVTRNPDFIELQRSEDKLRIRLHSSVYYWDGFNKEGDYLWKEHKDPLDGRGEWKKH